MFDKYQIICLISQGRPQDPRLASHAFRLPVPFIYRKGAEDAKVNIHFDFHWDAEKQKTSSFGKSIIHCLSFVWPYIYDY